MRVFTNIDDRLSFIEFRQELLFDNDDVCRLLFEYEITRSEYSDIMDIMDNYRNKIAHGIRVNHTDFENEMYHILPHEMTGNYHFCEYITKAFMENRRWEEVFWELYGNMPKYAYLRG